MYDMCHPKPTLTEENLPDQSGKVFIVTGGSGGIGKELVRMLYAKKGTVYIAARSEDKTRAAIEEIKKAHPTTATSKGRLEFLRLDLADLTTIHASAADFLSRETRLDVLWNNAGVLTPPHGAQTAQGYELQRGVNNVGPFLFTRLLYPLLVATAKANKSQANVASPSVRVVWVSSQGGQMAPKPPVDWDNMDYARKDESQLTKYFRSKAGNVLHAVEMARRSREAGDGVISVALHPGLIKSDIGRTMPGWQKIMFKPFMSDTKLGAYTELFAGLDVSITEEQNGGWVLPHGRLATEQCREDLRDPETAKRFWAWSEEQVKQYL